jgi:hypothetical protein
MASVSEKLRARLEDEFNIIIPKPLNRIHGAKGAACRWDCYDSKGHHYISEDTMADCLKAEKLSRLTCTKDIGVVYHVGPN